MPLEATLMDRVGFRRNNNLGYANLRQWLDQLRKDNDLAVIEAPVDPYLELAEIHRRVIREGGPALLFTNVKGTPFPVVTNLFGTARRVEQAFGPRPEQLVKSLMGAADSLLPPSAGGFWKEKGLLLELVKIGTRNVPPGEAPVLGVCRSSDPLKDLPRLTGWPEEGGPSVTLPLVYTDNAANPKDHTLRMYRIQIYDDHTAGLDWQISKGSGTHQDEADKQNEALPVSIFIGGPPVLMASAIAHLPERLPGLLMASMMLGSRLPMVKDPMGGHRIPAEAEFAIRGLLSPQERRPGGPFGDPNGYYSSADGLPVMHVQRMWHRKDAIYPVNFAGQSPQENFYLSDFLQRLLAPVLPLLLPVHSMWTYKETGSCALASAIIREKSSQKAMSTALRLLGECRMSSSRFLLLTSEAVDLIDFPKLLEIVLERFNPATDLLVFSGISDLPEGSTTRAPLGSKAILLGIGNPIRELPRSYEEGPLPGIQEAIPYCGGCLVVSGASYTEDAGLAQRLVSGLREKDTAWPLVVLVDQAAETVRTQFSFLQNVFTQFNPASDLYADFEVKQHHIKYKLPIVLDARRKPDAPGELFPREETVQWVDRNWKHYFPTV
jgi:UbiD family decarboxylase